MLYREIIAVCSDIHAKHINALCGQKVEFVNGDSFIKQVLGFKVLMRLKDQKSIVKNNGYQSMTFIQYRECQFYETTQIDTYYAVPRIMAYSGFLTLRTRDQYREARHRKFYLSVLQYKVFIKLKAQ